MILEITYSRYDGLFKQIFDNVYFDNVHADDFSRRKIFSKDRIRQRRGRSEHYRLNARCSTMSARDVAYVLKAAAVFARTIRKSSAADQSFPNREAYPSAGGQVSSIRCIAGGENIGKCFTTIPTIEREKIVCSQAYVTRP